MKQERPDVRRPGRRGYPLAAGLVASALLHLLLVLIDPRMGEPTHDRAGAAPQATRAQFRMLQLSLVDDDELAAATADPQQPTVRTSPFGTPGPLPTDVIRPGSIGADRAADPSVAERLRYNQRPFSPPVPPTAETASQRAIREARDRVRRAGEELGPLPPNGVAAARGGGGLGIRIPFGFRPPPPAITTPAPPPPDSILRRDSIQAAARAAARQDSLRAARDPARLRNVAPRKPIILPPVVPDTTG